VVNCLLVATEQDLAEWHTTMSYAFLISKRRAKLFANTVSAYVQLKVQPDVHVFICILYSSLFLALHVLGAICTHPQEHKVQCTATGVCNGSDILIHWSRYWLGHPHTFSTVRFRLSLQWINIPKPRALCCSVCS
jgi:hypothetical protein